MKRKTLLLGAALVLAACAADDTQQRAAALLDEARTQLKQQQFDAALATIDSLRRTYPKAIEARRQAIAVSQDAQIGQAQAALERTDSALQEASRTYAHLKAEADRAHAQGTATAQLLTATTQARMRRDSLQVQFDLLCTKIKYVRKKQDDVRH